MLTVKPFVSRTLRRLGADTHHTRNAVRLWMLEPACESERLAAIFDEDDLQRVTHTAPHTTMAYQVDALIRVASGASGTTEYGNKYFGHWFSDDVTMSMTARQFGPVDGHVNADNRLIAIRTTTPRSGQKRGLDNESAIADMVRDRGFAVIDPMTSSVAYLVRACANAQVVMGVEGSQLVHGFLPLLAPAGCMLTLQPPFKFDHFWKARCDCIGARYAFIVGTQTGDAGFRVEFDRVRRMLDRRDTVTTQSN